MIDILLIGGANHGNRCKSPPGVNIIMVSGHAYQYANVCGCHIAHWGVHHWNVIVELVWRSINCRPLEDYLKPPTHVMEEIRLCCASDIDRKWSGYWIPTSENNFSRLNELIRYAHVLELGNTWLETRDA